MQTLATSIEDFIKTGMTRNEIAEDLNMLYCIINDISGVKSRDYRCYVTPERELIIQFLTKTKKLIPEDLIKRILDESTMALHGIEDIQLYMYKEANDEITLENTIEHRSAEMRDLEDFISEEVISMNVIVIDDTIELFPFYQSLINEITTIKGFSFSTLSRLLTQLSDNNTHREENTKIRLQDKAIIHNTLDVFLEDIKNTQSFTSFKEQSLELRLFLNGNSTGSQVDENEATDGASQKEILSFLQYFLGAESTPFLQRTILYKNRYINIKFYLLLCLTYYAYIKLRKMERTIKMRKNKKRHIDYINAVLSGEYISIVSKHIIEYLHTQNDTFNPNSISQSDIDELKELIEIIEKRPEYYSRILAEANIEMFGKGLRPLNKYLHIFGFKGIGNSTKIEV